MGNTESRPAPKLKRKMRASSAPIIFPAENLKPRRRRSYRILLLRGLTTIEFCFDDLILENHPDGVQNYGKYTRAQKEQAMNMRRFGMSFHEIARLTGRGCSPSTIYRWTALSHIPRLRAQAAHKIMINRFYARPI